MYKFILDRKLTINSLLIIFLSISYFAWSITQNYYNLRSENFFKSHVYKVTENIEKRMLVYENALRSGVAFYQSSQNITREEWKEFVENLQIKKFYPGIQGLGITLMLKGEEIKPLESLMQDEGYIDFKLNPEGKREQYSAIIYLEPLDKRNMAAIGYDMFSQSTRRQAMELARDSGLPTISSRVTLVQEIDSNVQAGVLMYLPLYKKSLSLNSIKDRRTALIGYIYSVFRMGDLMTPALAKETTIPLELYDGEILEKNLLFKSSNEFLNRGKRTIVQVLEIGGRKWSMHAYSTQKLDKQMETYIPSILAVLGIVVSFLIYIVFLISFNSRKSLSQRTKELEDEKIRFSLAIESTQDGLWDWNPITNKVFFSNNWKKMLGYEAQDIGNDISEWTDRVHPDELEATMEQIKAHLNGDTEFYESTHRVLCKNGEYKYILDRGKAVFDNSGNAIRVVGFHTDITAQKKYQDKLEHTAKHDSLTKLPNRFLLSELLTHAMHVVKRNDKQLAVLFIDLDGFKEVNDTYGHDAGDEVLSIVASRMNAIVRQSDIVSRIGGDEFVIVMTDLNKSEELIPLLQRFLNDLSSDIKYNQHSMNVSASIGVSFYPQSMDIGNEVLIRQADQAMYCAKKAGKNQYQFFNIDDSMVNRTLDSKK